MRFRESMQSPADRPRSIFKDPRCHDDLLLRQLPISELNRFPNARECFDAITGVLTGSVDAMDIPRAAGKPALNGQRAFELTEHRVERPSVFRGQLHAGGIQAFPLLLELRPGRLKMRKRVLQRGEVEVRDTVLRRGG